MVTEIVATENHVHRKSWPGRVRSKARDDAMTPGKAWTETGKPLSEDTVVPFVTGDGRVANVIHVVRQSIGTSSRSRPTRGPVLLVHGAGVRANIFRAPVDVTLVDALLDDGFDVWLENWRASIDFRPN